mmetsp:Transcript_111873/g.316060  ORF Transcript_111873/g.316060 Transcript_111873/m.316060 type:complete len:372 (-) Transcript_111873:131-1246(-)
MAPKRELASEASPSRATKKSRISPVDAKCKQVIGGLKDSALSDAAFESFACGVVHCLGVVREERHTFQERIIDAIADVFGKTGIRLEKAIESVRATREDIQTQISAREAETESAAAKLAALKGEMGSHKVRLAEDAREYQAAKATLQVKLVHQTDGLNELKSAEAQKAQVEGLAKEMGTVHEASNKDEACADLVKRLFKHVDIDESMMTAIPCTLTKAPSTLGSFDKMVIEQLNASLHARVEKLNGLIASSDQVKESLEKDVSAAKSESDAAMKKQIVSARAFTAAASEVTAANEALSAMRKHVADLKKQLKASDRQVGEAEANSELFQDGPVAALAFLRERTAPHAEPSCDATPAPAETAEVLQVVEVAA